MNKSKKRHIHVVAGVLSNDQGLILLAQRPPSGHLAGYWEFPGGKVELRESRETALKRELHEEIGISIISARPLLRLLHKYDDRIVDLDVWQVKDWSGAASGQEGQAIAWVSIEELSAYPLPPADKPVIDALRCGECYLITPEPTHNPLFYQELAITLAAEKRIRLFQLRIKSPDKEASAIIAEAIAIARSTNTSVLLNGDPDVVRDFSPDGIHLPSPILRRLTERPKGFNYVGASCHDAQELHMAEQVADFAVLSPIALTTSHRHTHPLGWERFAALVAEIHIPVFALGGMTPAHLSTSHALGGQGIAAISGLWHEARTGESGLSTISS